jgi:DNA-binding NtrC family response regulator
VDTYPEYGTRRVRKNGIHEFVLKKIISPPQPMVMPSVDSSAFSLLYELLKKKTMPYKYPGNVRELKAIIDLATIMSEHDQIMDTDFNFNIGKSSVDLFDEELTLAEYEAKIIRHYLNKYPNVVEAAKRLGIGKSTIYNLLKSENKSSN